jgi:Antitoxin-like ribbon-helix-helix
MLSWSYENMAKPASLFHTKNMEKPAARPVAEPKKPKRGKHLISGMFEEPTYRQFTTLAAERGLQRQELLREALNDMFIKHGKPPIA